MESGSKGQGAGGRVVRLPRLVWVPGVQYGNETVEQMAAREARMRAMDAEIDVIERKADEARARPVWEC